LGPPSVFVHQILFHKDEESGEQKAPQLGRCRRGGKVPWRWLLIFMTISCGLKKSGIMGYNAIVNSIPCVDGFNPDVVNEQDYLSASLVPCKKLSFGRVG
jgi:hypothetical protein